MKTCVRITLLIPLAILLMGMSGKPTHDIQKMAGETGKQFSQIALQTLKSETGNKAWEAAAWYKELNENRTLVKAAWGPYSSLGAHAAFAAQVAEYIYRGGPNKARTRNVMKGCGRMYGKFLAEIFKGERIEVASQKFVGNFKASLDRLNLYPSQYRYAFNRFKSYVSAVTEVVRTSKTEN